MALSQASTIQRPPVTGNRKPNARGVRMWGLENEREISERSQQPSARKPQPLGSINFTTVAEVFQKEFELGQLDPTSPGVDWSTPISPATSDLSTGIYSSSVSTRIGYTSVTSTVSEALGAATKVVSSAVKDIGREAPGTIGSLFSEQIITSKGLVTENKDGKPGEESKDEQKAAQIRASLAREAVIEKDQQNSQQVAALEQHKAAKRLGAEGTDDQVNNLQGHQRGFRVERTIATLISVGRKMATRVAEMTKKRAKEVSPAKIAKGRSNRKGSTRQDMAAEGAGLLSTSSGKAQG